jgi:hypothetical protein
VNATFKLTIGNAITILTIVAVLAGFYYTTGHRLDALEAEVETLKKEVTKANKKVRQKRPKRGKAQ